MALQEKEMMEKKTTKMSKKKMDKEMSLPALDPRPVNTKVKRYIRPAQVFENANAQTIINIPVSFDPHATQFMWLSVWTRMFEKSWNSMPPAYGLSYILDAFQIMQSVTAQVMGGATPEIRQLPIFVQTVLNLMAPKCVAFRINAIKYSWDSTFSPTTSSILTVQPANVQLSWVFGNPDPTTEQSYLALIEPFPATTSTDPANLQQAYGLIENLADDTKIVETGTVVAGKNDPSAFARTFNYLGLGNSNAGGTYGECEQETNRVRSWIPAQFSVFQSTDTRASRSFRPKSGDSCLFTSLALMPNMRANDYQSGGPVIYKFIDFEEIYFYFTTWLVGAWGATLAAADITNPNPLLLSNFMFTSQTFRIILRQALLQCFSNQAISQFMSPKPQNGNNDNVFVPFLMHAGTYSQSLFGGMKFPLILAENMKMLKTTVLRVPGSKAKVVHIPVLGKWINDTYDTDPRLPINLAFINPSGASPQSIFMTPVGEVQISLYDGSGAPDTYYNFNGLYYQTAVDQFNAILDLFGNTGGNLDTVTGDAGPGLSLLGFTRYEATGDFGTVSKKQRSFEVLQQRQERVMSIVRSSSKNKLQGPIDDLARTDARTLIPKIKKGERAVNPPGSVFSDYTISISSNVQLTQPFQALLKQFIIPEIRPDPNDSLQPQTPSEWQIAYIEPNLATYQTGGEALVSSFRSDDLTESALSPITNVLNGAASNALMDTFNELAKSSSGPIWGDILKGVLGVGMAAANVFL